MSREKLKVHTSLSTKLPISKCTFKICPTLLVEILNCHQASVAKLIPIELDLFFIY